jgi:SpoVK/Ycf46/Vps4 family AAA+-type ATPase
MKRTSRTVPVTAVAPPLPIEPPPSDRLSAVMPGPDVLLTPQAAADLLEWIDGWLASAQLLTASIPPPGPLFLHGKPGTGKTSVTRMIARRLLGTRPVYVIDAMRVTEQWMGRTSANIAKAADAAIKSGAVLVLEEIDTLASARSYATSAEVENTRSTTSIMRVLELPGPMVLTSNRLDVIDPAVLRRCEYILEMPEPSPDQRRAIVAAELGEDPGPISLSLSVAIPLARRARRSAALGMGSAEAVFVDLVHRSSHGGRP